MKTKNWKHIGGGCMVGGAAKGVKYPCDDTYENEKTKETITVYSTYDAHINRKNFPEKINSISDLLKRGIIVRRKS